MPNNTSILGRVLILGSSVADIEPYVSAAEKLGVVSIAAVEAEALVSLPSSPSLLAGGPDSQPALYLHFDQRESALAIVEHSMLHPLATIIAAHERTAPTCARASSMMGLKWHLPRAADVCLDKTSLHQRLGAAGFVPFNLDVDHTERELTIAAILDGGKMRVLGIAPPPKDLSSISNRAFETVLRAAREVGLAYGPITAQVRTRGEQISISDLCAVIPANYGHNMRFRIPLVDEDVSLAEVVMRHALGLDISRVHLATTSQFPASS